MGAVSTRCASGHDRGHHVDAVDFEHDEWTSGAPADPFAFLDPRAPRFRFATGD